MSLCHMTPSGRHCDCNVAVESNVCCYCGKTVKEPPSIYDQPCDDDGSEENLDV